MDSDHGTKLDRIDVLGRNIPSAVAGLGTIWNTFGAQDRDCSSRTLESTLSGGGRSCH